ncbi:HdeD family acid-resistance protein [Streptomyces sp. HUAS TT20]|uniref:HdeD family acid-resistance protein n=1 Tax=Streptomyces sp. HUAS TT20 TaxID=3447509 RepID=UPI0021D986B7|nr:HdeD family acid-resistance protein [Streptomyces sp. HUAS 15-9]UXY25720.1 HdeD family acid-resistance protein [Streptomyces sp. HUAS 15-9]
MTAPSHSGPGPGPEQDPYGTAFGSQGDPLEVMAALGASWGWALASALVTLIPGIVILVWPHGTLHVVAVVIGLYLLVSGVLRFVAAFAREAQGERFARVLLATLFVVAGVLCLRHPLQTIAALSLIVGVAWLVSGMLTLYTAVAVRDLPHRGVLAGVGALGVVAGIVVLALPTESAVVLTRLLGLWLVLLGLADLVMAFALRAAIRRAEKDTV